MAQQQAPVPEESAPRVREPEPRAGPALRHCRPDRTVMRAAMREDEVSIATSKPRAETDPEDLGPVEWFLLDRVSDIEPNWPDRRFPRHTNPGTGADRR